MKSILVVNADDFGLTRATNQTIVDAFQSGIVTSASLLANGGAFDHAVELAASRPGLGVGLHLTLTEGPPVGPPHPALVSGGNFPLSNQPYVRALLAGRLPADAIRREFAAQAEKLIRAGITPTHVDGHKYIHLLPDITAIACVAARDYGIPAMRVPYRIVDPFRVERAGRVPGLLILFMLAQLARVTARRFALRMPNAFVGFVDTGHLNRAVVQRLLRRPRPGVTEMVCHPGYRADEHQSLFMQGYHWIAGYDFETETSAVSHPLTRSFVESRGWTLAHFGEAYADS